MNTNTAVHHALLYIARCNDDRDRRRTRRFMLAAALVVLAPAASVLAAWWWPPDWFGPPMRPIERSERSVAIAEG